MRLKTENRLNHVGIIHSENLMYSIVPIVSNAVFCTENFAKRIDLTLNALIIAKLIFQKIKSGRAVNLRQWAFAHPRPRWFLKLKHPPFSLAFPSLTQLPSRLITYISASEKNPPNS